MCPMTVVSYFHVREHNTLLEFNDFTIHNTRLPRTLVTEICSNIKVHDKSCGNSLCGDTIYFVFEESFPIISSHTSSSMVSPDICFKRMQI